VWSLTERAAQQDTRKPRPLTSPDYHLLPESNRCHDIDGGMTGAAYLTLKGKKMAMSDNTFATPVELTDAELDAVSAGLKAPANPLVALRSDVTTLVDDLLADLGIGKQKRM
jgi:hypothetical protein